MRSLRLGWLSVVAAIVAGYACGGDDTGGAPPGTAPDGGSPGPDGATLDAGRVGEDGGGPPTLDEGGTVTTSWLRGNDWGLGVLRQPDGKYVVVSRNDYQSALIITRFTASGVIDPTFGVGGYASPFLDRIMYAGHAATPATLLPDGRILLAVYVKSTPSDPSTMALLRLTVDGALDPTFGTDGVSYPMRGDPLAIALQADGKIVVAGTVFRGVGGGGVARFTAAGVLDGTFGDGGVVNDSSMGSARALAIDPAGNIVVAGAAGSSWKVARFLPGGGLDGSFGVQGVATTTLPGSGAPSGVAFGPGDTIVVSGAVGLNGGYVARYTSGGQPDTSFDADGLAGPFVAGFTNVAVQPDGRILTSRRGQYPTKSSVHRLNVDGSLDTTFGAGGVAADGLEASWSVLADPSGDVIVSGVFQKTPLSVEGAGLALTRLSPTGQPVTTFGSSGIAKTEGVMSADEDGRALLVEPDGKILVGGTGAQGAIFRFAKDGTIERSMFPFNPGTPVDAIALDGTGRIYAAGGRYLTRLLPAGGDDGTFANVSSSKLGRASGVVLHPSGKVVVAGESTTNAKMTVLSTDVNGDGSTVVESEYAPNALGDAGASGSVAGAYAIAVQPDGHMILGGWGTSEAGERDAAFVRIDADLALDAAWQTGGATVLDLTPASFENVRAVVALADGSVLGAGVAGDAVYDIAQKGAPRPTSSAAFVVHLLADGTPDPAFGDAGVWTSNLGVSVAGAFGLAVRPDGRILVAATRFDGVREEGVLVSLTSKGLEDSSFSPGGMRAFTYGSSSRLRAVAVDANGSILATGGAYTGPGGYDLALTRFAP